MDVNTRLALPYFFSSLFIGVFLPFLALFLQARGFTPWQIGVAISSFVGPRVIAPLFWGWLADKYRCTARLIFFTYLGSLGCLIFIGGQFDLAGVSLILFLMSFFWSGVTPLLDALTIQQLENQTSFYGRVRLWGSIGYLFAVTIAGTLLETYNAGNLVYVWIVTQVIGLVSFYRIENAPGYSLAQLHPDSQKIFLWKELWRKPDIILVLGATFLMAAAHSTYGAYYSLYLHDFGYRSQMIGFLFATAVITEIAVLFYMSRLIKYFTLKQMLLFSFGVAILRYMLIGYCASSLLVLICAQLMHGATFGMYHASAVHLISKLFPKNATAKGQAIYTVVSFGLGGVFGSALAGYVWQLQGGQAVFLTLSGFAFSGMILLIISFRYS